MINLNPYFVTHPQIINWFMFWFFFKKKKIMIKKYGKVVPAWRNFKKIFSRPLFTIIFRPKIVFLDTDSILRVKMMYESVK